MFFGGFNYGDPNAPYNFQKVTSLYLAFWLCGAFWLVKNAILDYETCDATSVIAMMLATKGMPSDRFRLEVAPGTKIVSELVAVAMTETRARTEIA